MIITITDSINQEIIIEEGGIQLILNLLNSKNFEIIQNSLLTLIFLINEDSDNCNLTKNINPTTYMYLLI
jgi:hypothetical protein